LSDGLKQGISSKDNGTKKAFKEIHIVHACLYNDTTVILYPKEKKVGT